MKYLVWSSLSFSVAFIYLIIFAGCSPQEEEKELNGEELAERGKYIVNTSGCNDCHTPKVFSEHGMVPDTSRLLSGHPEGMELYQIDQSMVGPGKWMLTNDHLTAWVGPWGVSFSANLTPDNETGIGAVSQEMFIKSIREGKIKGVGRPMLPPMPWHEIALMTDGDLKAVYAYLRSIKPVKNKVHDPIPPNKMASIN